MTDKQFFNALSHSTSDVLSELVEVLSELESAHCFIGDFAANAYAEPVVSLDVDIVISVANIDAFIAEAKRRLYRVEEHPHSINLTSKNSDLRVQIQSDVRYQAFIESAETKTVLGYEVMTASIENVLQGKLWACMDESRRTSKRQKDLADIARLLEVRPDLKAMLPESVKARLA